MVVVEGLSKSFGSKRVLNDISLEVETGEILAVMGSSGGGKTTLLRCISGLIAPTEGTIRVNEIDVQKSPEEARTMMGMVFQSSALFDYLNVEENVLFGVKRRLQVSHEEQRALVAEALKTVGLEGSEDLMPAELSGGMRKRVGIARALALNPQVMLYDEPTTGLDPITTFNIDTLIAEVQKKSGTTSILVSHDVASVLRTAARVAFLDKGELVFIGPPTEFERSSHPAIRELVDKSRATSLSG